MDIWVDIEDSSGNKYGSGPLRVASWESAPKLDEAGTFSFSLPASPEATALLQNKRVAHCYGILDGAVTELGMGIIDTVRLDASTPPTLTVSGPDILAELGNVSVGDLMIREQRWTYLNDPTKGTLHQIQYWSETGAYYANGVPLCHDGNVATHQVVTIHGQKVAYPETSQYLYVGYDSRYSKIRFKFHTPNAKIDPDDGLTIQYYSSEINGWKLLASFTDGTAIAGQGPWKQDGDIEFDPPDDWARYNEAVGGAGNWYWMRIRAKNNGPDNPRYLHADIAEISVYADFPTTNGVQMIMDFAPAGWTTNPSPVMTVAEKYLTFAGESVLNALIMLTEEGGQAGGEAVKEHFRLGTGRTIQWIGTAKASSGLTARAPSNTMDESGETVLISSLSRSRDTSEVVTRIYAWSGDGIGLIGSSRIPPAGYSKGFTVFEDAPQYYVQNDAAVATYGLIERWLEFSEISQQQTNTFTTHATYTADAVFDKAVEYLRSHAQRVEQYDLSIVRFPELLVPGKTIDCVYYEYRDGGQSIAIDTVHDSTPLWILSSRLTIDSSGVATVGLEVSVLDRSTKTDADIVVDLVRERKRSSGNVQNVILGDIITQGPPSSDILTRWGDQLVYGTFSWRPGDYGLNQMRVGNLFGSYGYETTDPTYGVAVGAYETGGPTLTIDPTEGLRLRQGATPLIQLRADGTAMISGWEFDQSQLYAGVGTSRTGLAPGTFPFYAGAESPATAPFRVTKEGALTATAATITGSITAESGTIGGWVISAENLSNADAILSSLGYLALGTGDNLVRLDAQDATYRLWAGKADAATAPFRVTKGGVLTASGAVIQGDITALTGSLGDLDVTGTLELVSGGYIQSDNYSSGLTGWRISYDGDAEFNNVFIRGTLETAVFQHDQISATSGSLLVTSEAGALAVNYTTGGTMVIEGSAWVFTDGSNVRIRAKDTGGLVKQVWVSVTRTATLNQYTTTKKSGEDATWPAGTAVVGYGTGGGSLMMTAMPGLKGPRYSVLTHGTSPWTDEMEQARLGLLDGWRGYSGAKYGIGIGDYEGGNYLCYEPDGGFVLKAAGALTIDDEGFTIQLAGSSVWDQAHAVTWVDSSFNAIATITAFEQSYGGYYNDFLTIRLAAEDGRNKQASFSNRSTSAKWALTQISAMSGELSQYMSSISLYSDDSQAAGSKSYISLQAEKLYLNGHSYGSASANVIVSGTIRESVPMYCQLYRTAVQSIPNWSWTALQWTHETADAWDMHGPYLFTFAGTGLNDMTVGGSFTYTNAPLAYVVEIQSVGATDTFRWSDDGGVTWDASNVAITGAAQNLNNGVTVTFGSKTGHTAGDRWTWTERPLQRLYAPDDGWYEVSVAVEWAANATGYRVTAIEMPVGSCVANLKTPNLGASEAVNQVVTACAWLTQGQFATIQLVQNSGGNLNAGWVSGYSYGGRVTMHRVA